MSYTDDRKRKKALDKLKKRGLLNRMATSSLPNMSGHSLQSIPKKDLKPGLFLDDYRNPRDVTWISYQNDIDWTVVRSVEAFEAAFKSKHFSYFSFDYDLGTSENGKDAMNKLMDFYRKNITETEPRVYFHTQQPPLTRDSFPMAIEMEREWMRFADNYGPWEGM